MTLRYLWKLGDRHAYSVHIAAETAPLVTELDGLCTYRVTAVKTPEDPKSLAGTGTGFVVAPQGYLISCAHVVEDASRIDVVLGGRKYRATVVDTDPEHDLALIRIPASGLPALALADSDRVEQAQEIWAAGFPLSDVLGRELKITGGSVAGLVHSKQGTRLQMDVTLNPGNSGGPILDAQGRVIGIGNAKLAGIKLARLGLAVPSNQARLLLARNGIRPPAARATPPLDGPQLTRLVRPAVALIEVTLDAELYKSYAVAFTSSYRYSWRQPSSGRRFGPYSTRARAEQGTLLLRPTGELTSPESLRPLPWLLGPLWVLPLEPLQHRGQHEWETELLATHRLVQPPDPRQAGNLPIDVDELFPQFFRRRPKGEATAILRRCHYEVVQEDAEKTTLRTSLELRTTDSATRPTLLLEATGTIVFNKRLATLDSVQYQGTVQQAGGEKPTRTPIRISIRRQGK